MFEKVVSAYQAEEDSDIDLICEAAHVDGGMNASQKEEKLDWLKAPSPEKIHLLQRRRQGVRENQNTIGTPETRHPATVQPEFQFQVGELERALYAKVVKKCGNPNHWEEWAADIAKIAKTHISRITQIVKEGGVGILPASSSSSSSTSQNAGETPAPPSKEFLAFANELRDDINDSITDAEVIEMLAQHLITKPVFDALFEDYSFASHNPVSMAMQQVLEILHEHHLDKEADTLEKFYASVKLRAASIDDVSAKQKIVVELYDKFFRNAFPKMTERLGIVYTPVEVVDFIIHSIDDLLQQEFGQTLGIRVIMGNPPYSVGQDSANDNNQNVAYPYLDGRIHDTYAAFSKGQLTKGLYDSYIRALRWASDRVGKSGIVRFVTNASFLDSSATTASMMKWTMWSGEAAGCHGQY